MVQGDPEHLRKGRTQDRTSEKCDSAIEDHYDECVTLDDLARIAGMNSKYFCRYFKEMTHRTPIDYLNYYRIEQACFKLATLTIPSRDRTELRI